jgi:hypothetical protein
MKKSSGFLLIELSLALMLSALSIALLFPLCTQFVRKDPVSITQLLKAHYALAHALRMISPLTRVELESDTIHFFGSNNESLSLTMNTRKGSVLTKNKHPVVIAAPPITTHIFFQKKSDHLIGLSVTIRHHKKDVTLIHPLYLV